MISIIFTYLIVLFQIFKSSKLNLLNPKNLLLNDNFQYLSLSIVWYLFSNKVIISGGLIPFLIYSIFHSLNYFKNYILPILPNLNQQLKKNISISINNLIVKYNEQSLVAASNLEILIFGQQLVSFLIQLIKIFRLDIGLILIKAFILFQYILFLKLRYKQSKQTKLLIDGYLYKTDVFFNSGRLPMNLNVQYNDLKQKVNAFLSILP